MTQDTREYRFNYANASDLEPYQNGWNSYPIHVKDDGNSNLEPAFRRFDTFPTIKDVRDFSMIGLQRLVPDVHQIITDDFIRLYLTSAINEIEMSMGIFLSPAEQTLIYDVVEGVFGPRFSGQQIPQYPVNQILSCKLKSVHAMSDNPVNTLDIPPNWISFRNRRFNIMADIGTVRTQSGTAGTTLTPYLAAYGYGPWRPNAIEIQVNVGFAEDRFPAILKELVLMQTSIGLLNDIIPILFPFNSTSVAIDGVSQSASLPGPQFLMTRIGMLEKLRDQKKAAIKASLGNSLIMTYVNT